MRVRAWNGYLLAAAAVSVVYFLAPRTGLSHLLLYNGLGASAATATVVGIRRNRPDEWRAWSYIAAGQAVFLAADVCFYLLELRYQTAPFPSVADAMYLSMYPLIILGLRRLVSRVGSGVDWTSLVDAAVLAVVAAAVFGVLVIDRYLADPDLTTAARIVSVVYPVMDIGLVAMAARVVSNVRLGRSGVLLLGGLTCLLIADLYYGILNSAGSFTTGGAADAFWLGFYILIGAAALHPDMARPTEPRLNPLGMTRPGVGALCLATLTVPVLDLGWGRPVDKLFTTICSCLLFLLVTTRLTTMVGMIQQQERRARHEAMHDALTGLANRVMFAQRIEDYVERNPTSMATVLFIDLNGFKQVNDTLGHEVGDQLLIEVGRRLAGCMRAEDLVARLSGDEFAVLLAGITHRADAEAAADRIGHELAVPVVLAGHVNTTTTASIGIGMCPCADFQGVIALLRDADHAMYQAKAAHKAGAALAGVTPVAD